MYDNLSKGSYGGVIVWLVIIIVVFVVYRNRKKDKKTGKHDCSQVVSCNNVFKEFLTALTNNAQQILRKIYSYKIVVLIIVTCIIIICILWKVKIIPERNMNIFKTQYEESLQPIMEKYSLELLSVEYTELIPDYDLEYYKPDRINTYEVIAYVDGEKLSYENLYNIIIDIRCANNYQLSNTYEIMSNGAYVDDDCKETGFHEVHTTLVFRDDTSYKIDYRSLLENNDVVWKDDGFVNSGSYSYDGECCHSGCDSPVKSGSSYCATHTCKYAGCTNSVDYLEECCYSHSCSKPGCSNHPYTAAGSKYCKRHYRETLQ